MKQKLWAVVRISVHPFRKDRDENGNFRVNHYHWHVIKEWHFPKWIINKHQRFFTYVQALVQSRFKFHYVSYSYSGYYPETNELMTSKRQLAISAAKAQVTKIENAISEYKVRRSQTLFSNYTEDPILSRLIEKLEQKKFNLQQAIMMDIEETF